MHKRRQVDRSPHLPIWIANVATTLLCTAGIASFMAWVPTASGNPDKDTSLSERSPKSDQVAAATGDLASTSVTSHTPTRATCAGCGVVELVREIDIRGDHAVESTRRYELTIRFQDGSTRVFNEATPRTWRPGARVMVID
jgi:hypothetical protein